jgi:23S rRNA (uridine2552-2'-O)-methyltransferase
VTRHRRSSSRRWLREHRSDPFVARAVNAGYRARSVYKLIEIDDKDALVRSGMTVVDLGAAPGAWSQYLARRVGSGGRVVALDLLELAPIAGVTVVQGDLRDAAALAALLEHAGPGTVDLVVSDMAPNMGGIRVADQARAMDLADVGLDFAERVLAPGGSFLVKVFVGHGLDEYRRALRERFSKVHTRKPDASRDRSRELYLLARGFRGRG